MTTSKVILFASLLFTKSALPTTICSSSSASMSRSRRRFTCRAALAVHATSRTERHTRARALPRSSAAFSLSSVSSFSKSAIFALAALRRRTSSSASPSGRERKVLAAASSSAFVMAFGGLGESPRSFAWWSSWHMRTRPGEYVACLSSSAGPSCCSFSACRLMNRGPSAASPRGGAFFLSFGIFDSSCSATKRRCAASRSSASTRATPGSRSSRRDMRKLDARSPIARTLPTASISVIPASSSFETSESIALFVAVHARMRAPVGTRASTAAVMKLDLPVPGGPCTRVAVPLIPCNALRCPSFSRATCFCWSSSP
mmetsp:Transcript_9057/g.22485  ORF Transcript_9057/g.22485 Transcript_9057/m.22485 type:complete len:316 (-) Transcript_9057:215-1162(-)